MSSPSAEVLQLGQLQDMMVYAPGTRWEDTRMKAPLAPRPQALAVNLNRFLQICHFQDRRSISRRWQMNQTSLSLPSVCSVILRFSNIIFIKFLGGISFLFVS